MGTSGSAPNVTREDVRSIFSGLDEPGTPLSTAEVAERLECDERTARQTLETLAELGDLQTRQINDHSQVWWQSANGHDQVGRQPELEEYGAFVSCVEDYAIFTLDPDGVVASWNEGAERIKGYRSGEIVGRHFSTFYTDADVDDGVPEMILETAAKEGRVEDEGWRVRKDGSRFWAHIVITAIRDDDGALRGFTKVTRDVTDRKERERELERARDLLEKTERIADVGGWEIDPDSMGLFWTDHVFDLLDVTADEEPSLDEALDMYHEDDRPNVESAVEEALDSGDSFDVEARIRTHGGEIRWLRLQGVPETVDGDVVSLRGAAQDVTERKQREQRLEAVIDKLEASNERLEQFAYAASHDLQEPLRMVSSYLQLIEGRYEDALDEDAREFIEFAVDGADRMRAMIEGLLEYSRVGTHADSFEPVDLNAVLEDVCDDLQMTIEESDAEITAEELPRVDGDEEQLRQVLQNLIDNAIEYSGADPPQVHVSAERNGVEWAISVRDEGIGIDPDGRQCVFEVFQSLHSQDDHSGTGIGLALCERIVERHGGEIWVDSEPGEGSTFTFTLPA